MKTRKNNFKELELEELNLEESLEIQGGWFWLIPLIVTYVIVEAALNPAASANAFMAGVNEAYDNKN